MLAELTETIVTFLNTRSASAWGEYKIPDYLLAEPCLDPNQLLSSQERKLFVMPLISAFSPENMAGRDRRRSVTVNLQISIALLIPFQEFSRKDVTDWDEVKRVLELRELIDLNIITGDWKPYLLSDIDPQPPVEIELNQRNFLSVTDFSFQKQAC